jgi:hypothetical protein
MVHFRPTRALAGNTNARQAQHFLYPCNERS